VERTVIVTEARGAWAAQVARVVVVVVVHARFLVPSSFNMWRNVTEGKRERFFGRIGNISLIHDQKWRWQTRVLRGEGIAVNGSHTAVTHGPYFPAFLPCWPHQILSHDDPQL
jgi:hypothetical protein